MKKKKVDPAKEAEQRRKDAARMQQMGEATAPHKRGTDADRAKERS
jgi:hypothetical protein